MYVYIYTHIDLYVNFPYIYMFRKLSKNSDCIFSHEHGYFTKKFLINAIWINGMYA